MFEEFGRVCVGSSNGGQVCQNVEEMCGEIVQCSLATCSPLQPLSSTWIIWATCNALLTSTLLTSTINQQIARKLIPREKTVSIVLFLCGPGDKYQFLSQNWFCCKYELFGSCLFTQTKKFFSDFYSDIWTKIWPIKPLLWIMIFTFSPVFLQKVNSLLTSPTATAW